MHCGFLSHSLFYLTHIVALDTFIVLLSYPLRKSILFYPYFLYFTSYLIPIEKLFYFQPYHIAITYTNPILNISEHCFNATLSL